MTAAEFRQLFEAVSTWGRWGAEDERGALNYLTPARVLEAARLVRTGETVTLSLPLNTRLGIDNPAPADHHMTMMGDEDIGSGTLRFAKDYVGADYHNPSHTHIDALCHVAFDGTLYNGRSTASLTREGATADDIGALKDGLVGRGVLLDVPALRGVDWLEPGEHVFPDELEGCERKQGVTVQEGDILLVRTGHASATPISDHGTATLPRQACTPPAPPFWRSGGLRRSDRMATATPPRARPRGSIFRSTR